ncbi:alpha/beta hydrolase [Pedobacter frigidisoli]|uniref:Alpha/beta hydrolase n=1 Tax=Pedobacter frigidisoli TaxID=2530455 RepID=A0A4R0NLF5_9SPHI|nr:alpha/beta hydrolase [Pedobacter frigidisoli]TCD00728.1 alpha/beta hydrolase [Pedobacter frigidisoli]
MKKYCLLFIILLGNILQSSAQGDANLKAYPTADTTRAKWMLQHIPPGSDRLQIPKPPYTYVVEDVLFAGKETGLTYGATLTRPKGKKHFPTVVLISGTGGQDRDYTCDAHKYFWVLADQLSRKGIAVLRIDDRGIGATTGDYKTSTSLDFAKDINAGVNYLRTRTDIDKEKIGLIGHSEGGIIAPMVYKLNPDHINFMILISAPVIGLREVNRFQSLKQFEKSFRIDSLISERMKLHRYITDNIPQKAHTQEELKSVINSALDSLAKTSSASMRTKLRFDTNARSRDVLFRSYRDFLSPWYQYILRYNPVEDMKAVKCPILGIFGSSDKQVPPAEDFRLLKDNIAVNKVSDVVMFQDMNHFMQTDPTGEPKNYAQISESIRADVLEKITSWILTLTL